MKTITLKPGDPCPNCGRTLQKAPQPTAEQRQKAANRDDPQPLSPHYDTAPQAVVDEYGELWTCSCGFVDRLKPAPASTVQGVRATSAS